MFSNLSKFTQLLRVGTGIPSLICLIPNVLSGIPAFSVFLRKKEKKTNKQKTTTKKKNTGKATTVKNLFQYSQYQENIKGRGEKRNEHNQKTDEMLFKPFKKKKPSNLS